MSRVLRANATDPRITRAGEWFTLGANRQTVTCDSQVSSCKFSLLFRGTGIKVYGRIDSFSEDPLHLELDGILNPRPLNRTAVSGGATPIYGAENMEDGDHQLIGVAPVLADGTVSIDHFEIENASGDAFDLLRTGPSAQNVRAQAVIVDDFDQAIIYHNESNWQKIHESIGEYGRGSSFTSTAGASLSYSFDGVAIWLYGRICENCGSFRASIDGLIPQRVNASGSWNANGLVQRMIWSSTSLDPGRHTLNITYDDVVGTGLYLDFFRVLGAGTSTLLSFFSTTTLGVLPTTIPPVPPTNQNQTNRVPLVVGLTLGLLVLTVVVLCSVRHICLRRGRRSIDAHSISPYTGPPIRRSDQQSSIPPVRKGDPQPGAPAAVDPSMSSSETDLGAPPSYETPSYDWRVDTAQ